ncbi:hypothetical protein FRC07_014251, partial [Ceratobasidium sp. 392]
MSSAEIKPTKGHALYVSELLGFISDLLTMSDWLSLMLTCKSMFPTVASRVWREVEAHIVMDLVTGLVPADAERPNGAESTHGSLYDFTRFDIYAPNDLRRICVRRAQEGTLLPNVASITLSISEYDPGSSESLFWLDMLFTPSLRELKVGPVERSSAARAISYPFAIAVLQTLIAACTGIKKLEFYLRDFAGGDYNNPSNSTNIIWPFDPRVISSCARLQRITSSISIFNDGGISALGALPRLQLLTLYGCGEQPGAMELSAAEDSFPSLTHLSLLNVDIANLPVVMGVEQLARGLTFLEIDQEFTYEQRYDHEHCRNWLNLTLPRLLEHTSQLEYFSYDATSHGNSYTIEAMPFLQAMSSLPLRHVSLSGIQLGGGSVYG